MEAYQRLEKAVSDWSGMPYVVACSSGTAALHLAMEALELPPGSKVLVPDYTMIACPRAVSMARLVPDFVDCGKDLLMDLDKVYDDRLFDLKAVMAVHIYGRSCNMAKIHEAAKRNCWFIIEDMAEAHGIKPGHSTDAACWSFYRNKVVHGEEGGAVGFRNSEMAQKARWLRSQGFTDKQDYQHIPRGCNYRLANLLAEPIIDSLRQVETSIAERRRIEQEYDKLCPPEWRQPPRDTVWVYDFRIPGLGEMDQGRMQDRIVERLNKEGIRARHGFKRMSCQQEYRIGRLGLTEAARASREVIYLPATKDQFVPDVFNLVREVLKS